MPTKLQGSLHTQSSTIRIPPSSAVQLALARPAVLQRKDERLNPINDTLNCGGSTNESLEPMATATGSLNMECISDPIRDAAGDEAAAPLDEAAAPQVTKRRRRCGSEATAPLVTKRRRRWYSEATAPLVAFAVPKHSLPSHAPTPKHVYFIPFSLMSAVCLLSYAGRTLW